MRRFIIIMLILLSLLLILTSCGGLNNGAIPEGSTLLKADISRILQGESPHRMETLGLNKQENDGAEWYVVYENVTKGDGIHYETIDSTEMQLILERGSIYVVGLAKKNDNGWIEMVGIVGDPYLGVTCIPVGDDATEVLDLGKLIEDEGILRSESVTPDQFSKMLGYSEDMLREFGRSDVTFKNFLNPDINRNGIIDAEENLIWGITILYDFGMNNSNPEIESFRYVFWINRDYVLDTYGEDFAVNSIGSEIFNWDKDIALLTNLDTGKQFEPSFVHLEPVGSDKYFYQWYFQADAPEDGSYRLDAVGAETRITRSFYYENLSFFNPTDNFAGLVIPIYKAKAYSDGKIEKIGWDWKVYTSDGMEDGTEEVIRLISAKDQSPMWVYFASKDQFFNGEAGPNSFNLFLPRRFVENIFVNNEVDLKSYDFWARPTAWMAPRVRGDFLMVGETDVAIHVEYEYSKTPHDFDPNSEGRAPTLDDLKGKWYNLYCHGKNWGKENLSFENGDKLAYISFDDNNRFEADWLFHFAEENPSISLRGNFEMSEEDPHVIILRPDEGATPIYMYVDMHETYMEVMISDSTPTGIDRTSEDYIVYSKYKPH